MKLTNCIICDNEDDPQERKQSTNFINCFSCGAQAHLECSVEWFTNDLFTHEESTVNICTCCEEYSDELCEKD